MGPKILWSSKIFVSDIIKMHVHALMGARCLPMRPLAPCRPSQRANTYDPKSTQGLIIEVLQ